MTILNNFMNPDLNAKSMFRWWFPDAGASHEKIKAQMKEIHEGGFAGVEVAFSPQFTDFDPKEYGWGTERWREIVRVILKTALEFDGGFKVDFHMAAHWPGTLNNICPNDDLQAQELVGAFEKLKKTSRGICRIPMPEIKTNDNDAEDAADYIFENKFVGMTVAKVAGVEGDHFVLEWDSAEDISSMAHTEVNEQTGEAVWTPAGIPIHETKYGDWPKLRDRQLYYVADRDSMPASEDDEDEIHAGDWLLFGFWRRGTGQAVSGRHFKIFSLGLPMAPKCYTVNYWDPAGMKKVLDFWEENILCDDEMRRLIREVGAATDSCMKGGGIGGETDGRWTANMPAEFYNRRGYDLMPYLPFLAFHDYHIQFYPYKYQYIMTADNGNEERLLEDFFQTCVRLHREMVDKPLMIWAERYNYGVRMKNYPPLKEGSWGSMEQTQAEGATLDLRMKMDNFRDIASGTHVAGKQILAAEANADELMAYRLTFKNICEKLNLCYTAGLNLAIFHGMSFDEEYSGKYSQWPGWHCFQFSFAGAWGRRNPWWNNVHFLSDYLSRVQAVLQSGTAKLDLLIYEPFRDADMADYDHILSEGYSYDCGGEAVLMRLKDLLGQNTLMPEGPAYKAVVLRNSEAITMPALKILTAWAKKGFPVICVGKLPKRVYGLSGSCGVTDDEIVSQTEQLRGCSGFYQAEDEKGVLDILKKRDIYPSLPYHSQGVRYACREDGASKWYYIYNSGNVPEAVLLKPGNRRAYAADPWSGNIFSLNTEKMIVSPGEARFLIYADKELGSGYLPEGYLPEGYLPEYCKPGNVIAELEDFNLVIDSWGPAEDKEDPCRSKHTLLDMGKVKLQYWDQMEGVGEELKLDGCDSMYHVSGIGTYRTKYCSEAEKQVFLVIQSGEDQVLGIRVNGNIQPAPDAVARLGLINLEKGDNIIEIIVASTLRRRVNKENPFFTENDFEIMFGCIDNYGNAAAPDPKTMNRYGITSVKICEAEKM